MGSDAERGGVEVARDIKFYLEHKLKLGSNTGPHDYPGPKDKTSGFEYAEVPAWALRQWMETLNPTAAPQDTPTPSSIESLEAPERDNARPTTTQLTEGQS